MAETEKKSGIMQKIGFPAALVVFAVVWFVPFGGMDELTRHTMALMLFTVVLWVTRPIMPALTAMAFMVLAWGLGLAKSSDAFSGFATTTPWFIWGALVLALAVKESGLNVRLASYLATKTPASSKGMIGSYYLLTWLLSYVIPSASARLAATAPIAASQVETLGIPLKSRTGKMLMTSLITVNNFVAQCLLTGGATPLVAWGVMNEIGIEISWIQWWLYMLVPCLAGLVILFLINLAIFKPEPAQLQAGAKTVKEAAKEELAKLGPISPNEIKVAVIMALTVILWATESFTGLDTALVAIIAAILLMLPVVGVLKAKDGMRKIGWDTVIFVAAAMSIGTVTENTGVTEVLKGILSNVLSIGGSEFMFLLMMLVLGFLGKLVLRSGAANAAVLLVPSVTLAQQMGYNAGYVGLLFSLSISGIFIYQHNYGLIAYDYGTFEETDFIKNCLARYVAIIAFIVIAYFVWWPLVWH